MRPLRIAKARRERILWAGAALLAAEPVDTPAEEAFMRAWVRLEAVAKADGAGLARTLAALGVWQGGLPDGRSEVAARVESHLSQISLKVHDLAPMRGSVAALALDRAVRAPLLRAFPSIAPASRRCCASPRQTSPPREPQAVASEANCASPARLRLAMLAGHLKLSAWPRSRLRLGRGTVRFRGTWGR